VCSNTVNYTIDNASGYWLLNPGGSISNTNSNGVQVSWLSRGAPINIQKTNDDEYNNNNPYIVPNTVNWIITGGEASSALFIELPSGPLYIGREIMIKMLSDFDVKSTSPNIISLNSPVVAPGSNIIVPGNITGQINWSTLVYDGNKWIIMQANWEPTT
jgi:hypothetical protein